MGHFHPTESVADKISAILQFSGELMLHVSRGVRWDSDHVVIFNDELKYLSEEVVRSGRMDSIHIALDFFDATIHRVMAWVIGARSAVKAMLWALLQPNQTLRQLEENGELTQRLALMESMKTMPFGAVWNEYCRREDSAAETAIIQEIESYEKRITSKRG